MDRLLLPEFSDSTLASLANQWVRDSKGFEYEILTKPKRTWRGSYTCVANIGYLAIIEIWLRPLI